MSKNSKIIKSLVIVPLLITSLILALQSTNIKAADKAQDFNFEKLPIDIQADIIKNLFLNFIDKSRYKDELFRVIKEFKKIALVNKKFFRIINDPWFTNYIIKLVSKKYDKQFVILIAMELNTQSSNAFIKRKLIKGGYNSYEFLLLAAEFGNTKIVKFLLAQNKTNINVNSNESYIYYLEKVLIKAVKKGHVKIVVQLLDYVNYNDEILIKALALAAKFGHTEIINRLLVYDYTSIKNQYKFFTTLFNVAGITLFNAVSGGHNKIVEKLLAYNADVNVKNKDDFTALMLASRNGRTEIVRLLLAHPNIDVNANFDLSYTALMLAVINGNTEIVELLLAHKDTDVNFMNDRLCGSNALIEATENGHTEIVKLLLAHPDTDVNANKNSFTALMHAAAEGHVKIVELLLNHDDIQVNAKNDVGYTALFQAALGGYVEIADQLLTHSDTDVNAQDKYKNTALVWAVRAGQTEIVKLLLAHNDINVNIKGLNKMHESNALIEATENGQTEIVKLLLAHDGTDVNVKNKDDFTALMLASRDGHTEIVRLLLARHDIDVNAKLQFSYTVLMLAARNGNTKIVELLLAHKDIDVNAKNDIGNTALMLAVVRGHTEIVKLLAHPGTDVNAQNKYNISALTIAASKDNKEIIELLITAINPNINNHMQELNKYYDCGICYTDFEDLEIATLKCDKRHKFCYSCLSQYNKSKAGSGIPCPFCRAKAQLPEIDEGSIADCNNENDKFEAMLGLYQSQAKYLRLIKAYLKNSESPVQAALSLRTDFAAKWLKKRAEKSFDVAKEIQETIKRLEKNNQDKADFLKNL